MKRALDARTAGLSTARRLVRASMRWEKEKSKQESCWVTGTSGPPMTPVWGKPEAWRIGATQSVYVHCDSRGKDLEPSARPIEPVWARCVDARDLAESILSHSCVDLSGCRVVIQHHIHMYFVTSYTRILHLPAGNSCGNKVRNLAPPVQSGRIAHSKS